MHDPPRFDGRAPAEHGTIDRARLDALLDLAAKGLDALFRIRDGAV